MAEVGDYRYAIPGGTGNEPRVTGRGYVHFDVYIQVCTSADPETWQLIPQGHFTLQVPGTSLEQCASAAEAKNLLAQLILETGLTQSDRAQRALIALLPGGEWPESNVTYPLAW